MSAASTPIKVLRTALKRVEKGWTQDGWHTEVNGVHYVCLEGAIYGYCKPGVHEITDAQRAAAEMVLQVIKELYGFHAIPQFNDWKGRYQWAVEEAERTLATGEPITQEQVMEVIKLAIIRYETGGDEDPEIEEDDFAELLEWAANQ